MERKRATRLKRGKTLLKTRKKQPVTNGRGGKGGFVRVDWNTAETIIAPQLIYTLREYGANRIFGFSPIPAMPTVSYTSGARFLNLPGAPLLSFYDWYAGLPPASPQVWGEQPDIPESSDWYSSGCLLIRGSTCHRRGLRMLQKGKSSRHQSRLREVRQICRQRAGSQAGERFQHA